MKSKLFYLLSVMLLAYAGNVKADELVVQNFELEPGQQTTVAVELNNPDTQYIMLDFYIQLPSGVTIASDEDDELMYELNSTRARRSHSLDIREQSNGSYHVLLHSSSNEALKGTSGAVFTMTLEADASATPGDYTGTLTNQLAMDINRNKIYFPDRSFNVTITAVTQPQSLSLDLSPMTYGDSPLLLPSTTEQGLTLTWTSDNASVATVSGNTLSVTGVGTATVTATQAGDASHNPFSQTFTLTVSKAVLTVTADDCSRMEGVQNPDFTISYSGFKYNDNASSLTTQPTASSEATTSSPAGTYPITVSGGASDNYEFNYVNGTLTVTAKNNQTISLSSIPAMTYGDGTYTLPAKTDQNQTLTWTCNNTSVATISGNTLTVNGAGVATITATQAGNGTYNSFSKTFTLTVNKAPLTITADDKTKTSGQANPTLTVSYSGFVNGESSSVLTTQPTLTTTATASSAAGNYPITVSGAAAANYEIIYVEGTLTVMKADQSVTLTSIPTMTYGDAAYTLPAKTAQNQTLTWASSNANVATVSGNTLTVKGAGTSTITATQAGNGTYNSFRKAFVLTVNKAPLTITADDKTKTAGEANPTLTVSYSGFVNGETASVLTKQPAVTTTATTNSVAGEYPITASGAAAANYSITYVAGTLTVVKADQSVTLTAIPTMTYGDAAYTLPAKTAQNQTLTWKSSNTNVAAVSGNTLTVKGAGTSTITATQAGNGTYNSFSKTFTLTVNKAPLTITADEKTKTAGQANPALTVSYSGFVNGETASVLTKQPAVTTTATTNSVAGEYPITASDADADNYEITYVAGTLTIVKADQSVLLTELPAMTYGDAAYTLPATTADGQTLTWMSDNSNVASVSGNTLTVKGAGTATVTASHAGDASHNPFSQTFTLTVGRASLTITADDKTKTAGEANPELTVSYEGFVNGETASVLTKQPVVTTTATTNSVAGEYPITASNADAANYEITYVAGTLTVVEDNQDLYIQFADAKVKSICVRNWDTNGDGELSYNEAATVTDIGQVFSSSSIQYFNELQYFIGLTDIKASAFSNSNLRSIIIPSNVASIGCGAFSSCHSLTSVTISEGVSILDKYAFHDCYNLTSISIPSSVTSIGDYSFEYCRRLSSVAISEGVTSIGQYAFYKCGNLTSVTIPSGVTSIGQYAFCDCTGLASVSIPSSVRTINDYAFQNCSALIKVIVPDISAWCRISFGNDGLGNPLLYAHHLYSDERTEIKDLVIPSGVTSIGKYAFYGCTGLTSVSIPSSVRTINDYAFENCSALSKVIVPDISAWCRISFGNDGLGNPLPRANHLYSDERTEIKDLVIPDGVSRIGKYAFIDCTGLTSVTIPSSVTSIREYAFWGCTGLSKVIVPDISAWCIISFEDNANPLSYAHHLYSDDSTEIKDLVIPDGVSRIGQLAFYGCTGLTSVTIPSSVKEIGISAFGDCSGLSSVTIPESVTAISRFTFGGCSGLMSVTIPKSVTTIGSYAFYGCSSLVSVTIPENVTSIGTDAFYGCSSLVSVTVEKATPVNIRENVFSNRTNAILFVPVGSKNVYQNADYWKEFKEILDGNDMQNTVFVENQIVEHGANTTFPVYMTNPEAITAVQFEIVLPDGVRLLDCELTDRKEDHDIQYSQLENGNYQVLIISFSSSNFKGSSGSFVNLRLGTDVVGTYRISVKNLELTTSAQTVRKPLDSSADLTICDIPLGDTNGDGHITITDAVAIVNYKLGRPSKSFVSGAADVNHDGSISITDAVIIVNWILHEETGSSAKNRDTLKFVDTIDPQ